MFNRYIYIYIYHIISHLLQPPPPGYAPTAAQQAYSQGGTVQVSQQRKDFWGGGSDGGYTLF